MTELDKAIHSAVRQLLQTTNTAKLDGSLSNADSFSSGFVLGQKMACESIGKLITMYELANGTAATIGEFVAALLEGASHGQD
jgi:5,10-methylene-tetrahydrofolate dehydrogenase/methenyl tetrahydrofolate cyclohydrolase